MNLVPTQSTCHSPVALNRSEYILLFNNTTYYLYICLLLFLDTSQQEPILYLIEMLSLLLLPLAEFDSAVKVYHI